MSKFKKGDYVNRISPDSRIGPCKIYSDVIFANGYDYKGCHRYYMIEDDANLTGSSAWESQLEISPIMFTPLMQALE